MPHDIHPELKQAVSRIPKMAFRRRSLWLTRPLLRLLDRSRPVSGVTVTEHRDGGARVRVHRPEALPQPTAGLLWIHGGGYIIGAPDQDDAVCSRLARDLGIVVAAAHYRLAPRHPFPAALDDCAAAWRWLQQHVGTDRLAIGGMSAGGGLAATLAQRLCDEGGPQPAAQLLLYPMLDDRTATNRALDAAQHPLWNNESNLTGWSCYLGHEPGQPEVPDHAVAARRADLSGLPPAWIGIGDCDLFHAEDLDYARRLVEAGVPCELKVVTGAVHGFDKIAPEAPISQDFAASQRRFLRERLALR